jgi:hypothetical protein
MREKKRALGSRRGPIWTSVAPAARAIDHAHFAVAGRGMDMGM